MVKKFMSVIKSTDVVSQGITYGSMCCPFCCEEIEECIGVYKVGFMCVNCAQNMVRIIPENLIKYHNGKAVSLLDIMQYGDQDYRVCRAPTLMFWMGERYRETESEIKVFYDILMRKISELDELYKNQRNRQSLSMTEVNTYIVKSARHRLTNGYKCSPQNIYSQK